MRSLRFIPKSRGMSLIPETRGQCNFRVLWVASRLDPRRLGIVTVLVPHNMGRARRLTSHIPRRGDFDPSRVTNHPAYLLQTPVWRSSV